MIAFARPVAVAHCAQTGRSCRLRISRVRLAYDSTNPSGTSSSSSVIAHKCGSSTSLAVT